jgi:hypothetical protein
VRGIAQGARIEWPIRGLEVIDRFKCREKRKEMERWASLKSQGKAVSAFKESKITNAWLINPNIMRPSKYITALKMRPNVAADRASLSRAKLREEINCRKCHVLKESLGHILGQCASTVTALARPTSSYTVINYRPVCPLVRERVLQNNKAATV